MGNLSRSGEGLIHRLFEGVGLDPRQLGEDFADKDRVVDEVPFTESAWFRQQAIKPF